MEGRDILLACTYETKSWSPTNYNMVTCYILGLGDGSSCFVEFFFKEKPQASLFTYTEYA